MAGIQTNIYPCAGASLSCVQCVHLHMRFFENPFIAPIKLESFDPKVKQIHRIFLLILNLHTRSEIHKEAPETGIQSCFSKQKSFLKLVSDEVTFL